ncbi:unnamed protein product, partial [Nesidiocoris tenuis]
MGPDQRSAIRRALNEDADKLLAEGDPSDPQLRRLRREMDEVNRLFDEFERRARLEDEQKLANELQRSAAQNAAAPGQGGKHPPAMEHHLELLPSLRRTVEMHRNRSRFFGRGEKRRFRIGNQTGQLRRDADRSRASAQRARRSDPPAKRDSSPATCRRSADRRCDKRSPRRRPFTRPDERARTRRLGPFGRRSQQRYEAMERTLRQFGREIYSVALRKYTERVAMLNPSYDPGERTPNYPLIEEALDTLNTRYLTLVSVMQDRLRQMSALTGDKELQ